MQARTPVPDGPEGLVLKATALTGASTATAVVAMQSLDGCKAPNPVEQTLVTPSSLVASGNEMDGVPARGSLPVVDIESQESISPRVTRRGALAAKQLFRSRGATLYRQASRTSVPDDKAALFGAMRSCHDEADRLEDHLQNEFIPQHSPAQFLGPRAFFESALFNVRSNASPRDRLIEVHLKPAGAMPRIDYVGPELRQSDGLVFLALLHMLRDVQTGTSVCIDPAAVCRAVLGRYDGASRKSLGEHIQRLEEGLVVYADSRIQLCRNLSLARTGPWTVALDHPMVGLFKASPAVWFPLHDRLALPTGIATWLLTYIACQTRLIPTPLSALREKCGSDATEKAFANRLRDALRALSHRQIIDPGWFIEAGRLHWRKRVRVDDNAGGSG